MVVNYSSSGTTSSTFGAGTSMIYLGAASGSASATLAELEGNTNSWNQSLTVQGSGTDTLAAAPAQGSTANNYVFGSVQMKIPSIILNNNLTLQSIADSTFFVGFNNNTVVSGSGNITIAGPGRVGFASGQANTFTGTITVNSGATFLTGDGAGQGGFNNALGNAANAVVMGDNSTLGIFTGGGTNTHNFTVGANVLWSRDGNSGNTRFNGTITDNGNGLILTGAEGFSSPNNDIELGGNITATLSGPLTLGGISLARLSAHDRQYVLAGQRDRHPAHG